MKKLMLALALTLASTASHARFVGDYTLQISKTETVYIYLSNLKGSQKECGRSGMHRMSIYISNGRTLPRIWADGCWQMVKDEVALVGETLDGTTPIDMSFKAQWFNIDWKNFDNK